METSSDNEQNVMITNVATTGQIVISSTLLENIVKQTVEHAVAALAKAMGTSTRPETTPDRGCFDDADEQVKDDLLRQETDRDPSVEHNDQKKDLDGISVGTHLREGRRSNIGGDGSSKGKAPKTTFGVPNEQEYVTREDLMKFMEMKRQAVLDIDFRPPYPQWISMKPYPKGYKPAEFRKFDGQTGHAKEHVMCFIDDLGIYGQDKELRLREFSKSLTGKAYTWYNKLAPESICSWEEMAIAFCGKFFESQPTVHVMDLGRVKQCSGEDAIAFIKRHSGIGMQRSYARGRFKLIERAQRTVASMKKAQKRAREEATPLMTVAALEEQPTRTSNQQGSRCQYNQVPPPTSYENTGTNGDTRPPSWRGRPPPPYPCSMEDVYALLEIWVRDGNIELPKVNHQVTEADRKSGHFCVFHQSTTHPTEDCYQLRQIFQRRYKAGELEATTNVQNRPLPAHAVLGAGPLRIDKPKEVEVIQPQEDNDNVVVAKGLAKSTNFRAFFDLLEFDEDAKAQAALSIVEIAQNIGGSCYAVESYLRKTVKAHHSAIIFKDTERKAKHSNHNRPLYVEAEVAGLKVRRAMIDGGSSVNIIPYSVLKKTNYPEHLMEKSVTSLGGFNGSAVKTMGAVTLNLKVGPFVTANKFYVIDSQPSYHILLGRPWIHSHDVVPSTLHQCVKSNYKGRDIEIPATRAPFDEDETHFVEALFFDEHAGKGINMSGPPVGIKLEKKKEKVEECKKKEGKKGCVGDTGANSSGIKKIMGDAVGSSLGTKRHATEVFEAPRKFNLDIESKIKTEIEKLLKAGVDENKVKAVLVMNNPGSKDDKGSPFKWEKAEQEAFEKIKKVLASTQTMSPPTQGRPMALYLTSTNQSISALLVQEVEGIEKPIYYLSRLIKGAETRYSAMEKHCLALIYATQKFRHYFLAHSINLMTKSDPIRFLLKRPILFGRLTRRTLIIGEFDITPVLPRAIRSQALADLLALFPSGNHEPINDDLPGELPDVAMCEEGRPWELHFDGSPSQPEGGPGIVLTSPEGKSIPLSYKLSFPCTNNEAEYEALILGLLVAQYMGIQRIHVKGDSNLVVKQVTCQFGVKEPSLATYRERVFAIAKTFKELKFQHIVRSENRQADALAGFRAKVQLNGSQKTFVTTRRIQPVSILDLLHCPLESGCWQQSIISKLKTPKSSDMITLKDFYLQGEQLFRKGADGLLMGCVSEAEGREKMKDIHSSMCGREDPSLYRMMQRFGYYWPSMKEECNAYQAKCQDSQENHEALMVHFVSVQGDWRRPYIEYIRDGILPLDNKEASYVKKRAARYFMDGGKLFRRSLTGQPMRCISQTSKHAVMEEVHQGACGEHQGARKLYEELIRIGYYWPTIEADALAFVRRCLPCQKLANSIHAPAVELHALSTPWPFHTWALDLIGSINPNSRGKMWILAATELFSKWVEAVALKKANVESVATFIKENIICRFGLPKRILSDNGTPFINKVVSDLLAQFNIMHDKSSPYYPKGNGQAEATNKSLLRILSIMVQDAPRDWSEYLPLAGNGQEPSSRAPSASHPLKEPSPPLVAPLKE
ncbi:reverse transcriptase [Senna tora]|uniref:Reverse transcriptase n=1 Tax=Senna tora TaxID=362788 RepID=A0A834X6D9_9FABA|nr:reverse transcriptase [Senna tora]